MGIKDIPGQIRGKGRSAGNTRGGRTKTRNDRGAIGANGLKDVWIIGESFFREVGVVFDVQEKMVGFHAF